MFCAFPHTMDRLLCAALCLNAQPMQSVTPIATRMVPELYHRPQHTALRPAAAQHAAGPSTLYNRLMVCERR